MVLNTITVGAAVTPAVIQTYLSHYLNRKPRHQKPTAHISYDEGLHLIRRFLYYASHHTVEELQAFTAQWVPHPRWVKVDQVPIPEDVISKAASVLIAQLGEKGINRIGGREWWRWRRKNQELKAEWIEMRNDYNARKRKESDGRRVMLYVHGGAYFFGSTDEHRYQMQRHARKLRARVFAPRYRLAPQFPFPCGLLDCLATYIYLLTVQHPTDIILAGDSAGAGMVVSLLVLLRDQGLALPAGTILISPWVDLTHSFPSLNGSSDFDYIPAHGFMQRPSAAWPPPNDSEIEAIYTKVISRKASEALPRSSTQVQRKKEEETAVQGFAVYHDSLNEDAVNNPNNPASSGDEHARPGNRIPGPGHQLSIMIDGAMIELKDQIQMYTTNQLISHPLVSPVLQPSLGGLPPVLILTGGGELLRDEQIYLAHKMANPARYAPGDAYLDEHDPDHKMVDKFKPTDVQLQVWDDLCHVAPTLSFTRPAKYMYRSVAQFGAWALARAQKTSIDIMDDDDISVISVGSSRDSSLSSQAAIDSKKAAPILNHNLADSTQVGRAGDPLPHFHNHMIRQRVDRNGNIYSLGPASDLPALQMSAAEVGVIQPGPVKKWVNAKKQWDTRYASEKRRIQRRRIKDMMDGLEGFSGGEVPPPSALAGRRKRADLEKTKRVRKSIGLMMWSFWGSHHDESTLKREEEADGKSGQQIDTTVTTGNGRGTETTTTSRPRAKSGAARLMPHAGRPSTENSANETRRGSRRRTVTDAGQTEAEARQVVAAVNGSAKSESPTQTSGSRNRTASSHHSPFGPTNFDGASIVSSSTAGAKAPSENASTTAVFAVPGVMPKRRHGRKLTASSLGTSTIPQDENDERDYHDEDVDEARDEEYQKMEPETSRRGSLQSVERLRSHQVPAVTDKEVDSHGQYCSENQPSTAPAVQEANTGNLPAYQSSVQDSTQTQNHEQSRDPARPTTLATNAHLSSTTGHGVNGSHPSRPPFERNTSGISAVAVKDVEGVLKPKSESKPEPEPGSKPNLDFINGSAGASPAETRLAGSARTEKQEEEDEEEEEENDHQQISSDPRGEVENEETSTSRPRPSMPERDEFVTALE